MAKIGFEYIAAAKLTMATEESAATAAYTEGREIGPGSNFNGTPTADDVTDYGDDRALLTDVSVTGGTISAELNEPTMENEAWMLGHAYEEETGMIRNANDIPPYLGIGFVGKARSSTVAGIIYRAKIYLKTQFREPNDENTTKQQSTTFNHTTMEGNIFTLKNGDWKKEQDFTTLDEAKEFINDFLKITDAAGVQEESQEESGTV